MSNFIPLPPTYAVSDPQVRAVLDVLTRNMQVVIDAGGGTTTNTALTSVGGASTFGSGNSSTNITNLAPAYTLDTLTADLKRGAAEVITGITNGTTVMKLEPAGQYVVFQHKDAVILGTTGAYAGTIRTGLGITSTGILGGYNRTSDGAWQTTFAIESSTGNLTLLGTIRAASIISVDAYLGSTLVSDVVNNSAAVTTKLNKSAADILSGTIDFQNAGGFKTGTIAIDGSGNATGAGVAFTSKGIVGRNVGATTFTIDAVTGAATFAGALVAASGSFVGTVSAGAIIADSVTLNSAGGTSLSIIAGQASGALPSASFGTTLQSSLNSGVTNILAGTGSNYRLKVDASLAFIAFQHKDAVYNGTSAAGLGILPAVGISSAGIAMGYNDNTGAWNNSVAISAAGNLTVKGTISAGSIIVGSVTIGAGGTTLTAVEGNASSALSLATSADANATSALSQVTNKLNKNAADILSGTITFTSAGGFKTGTIVVDGSGNATGAGVAITSRGIVGRTAADTTFTIDATTGAATFKGDITGGANINITGDALFYGQNLSTNSIVIGGLTYFLDYSVYAEALTLPTLNATRVGFYGRAGSSPNVSGGRTGYNVGVVGYGQNVFGSKGIGVVGQGDQTGGYFSGTEYGVIANSDGITPRSLAITDGTYFRWGLFDIITPGGTTTKFLRDDGTWQIPPGGGGAGTVTSVSGTGTVSGLTLSGTVTTSGNLTLGGTLSLTSGNVTSALGYTPLASAVTSVGGTGSVSGLSLSGSVTSTGNLTLGGSLSVTQANLIASAPGSTFYLAGNGWTSTSPVMSLAGTNSGTATVASNTLNILGSTSTGIAGAYVGSAGSGNTVTLDVRTTSPSDRRLKDEIKDIDLGLAFVNKLRPVSYKLKADPKRQKGYGLIADEVEEHTEAGTSLVYLEPDWKVGNEMGFKTIHYPSYVAVLIKAVQELSAKVEALES